MKSISIQLRDDDYAKLKAIQTAHGYASAEAALIGALQMAYNMEAKFVKLTAADRFGAMVVVQIEKPVARRLPRLTPRPGKLGHVMVDLPNGKQFSFQPISKITLKNFPGFDGL